ncbi:SDR family NAD(P)-dependent oxidoreductase [Nostoc favosum]|uniref:SDR family NAD(P)-dependent oxidoreductase n=1 Tax=Nostoc favosum CHAB5714 TaxID=2780399 RepID=A0ABS8IDK4_9NOSO|nr:SDR family NAD(P)-dependent oxidoreductase [Nostoc favosum]MCC5602121.1 SDR family NAD(P)-dependent oxidoreductase [Nostoc favosum CHAB5714]
MSNKICAVVGVGPGLGFAIAKKFGREGYQIALLARRLDKLEDYKKGLEDIGVNTHGFCADASDCSSLETAFEKIRQTLGHPEVLVYNAGELQQGYPTTITATKVIQDFKVNLVGALVSVQQVVPHMRKQNKGTILLSGGGSALEPFPEVASMCLGKAAIRNLSFSLTQELEEDGVHVATVTICGFIQPGTRFDPDKIAQEYWKLHAQEQGAWEREYIYGVD